MLFILLLCFCTNITNIYATYVISVYGDAYKDTEFFTRTFPWIIDNIGGEIMVDFYMLGSGRYTVPQMCALEEMNANTFLQAQFLKCEAEGRQTEYCLCETGIDPQRFKECVSSKGSLAAIASAQFSQVGIDVSPLIELGPRSTVFKVEDNWYLKKICTIFGDNLPRGCAKPFSCNGTEAFGEKRAIAQFDKHCVESCDANVSECSFSTTSATTETTY